jgi:hypothetical protein
MEGHLVCGSFAGSAIILLDFLSPFLLRISACVLAFPSVIALPVFLFLLFWGVLFSQMWGKFAESQPKSQVTQSLYEVKTARTQQTTELMQVQLRAA